jgi:hypothetical protein
MNVVVLIGNGFDIGMGLDTRYSDFINWYLQQKTLEDPIICQFREQIAQNKSTWADAERAFGQMSFSEMSNDVVHAAQLCLSDFQRNLCAYLDEQNARFKKEKVTDKLREQFRKTLIELLKEIRAKKCQELRLFDFNAAHLNITPINFNYTFAFDELIGFDKRNILGETQRNPPVISHATFNECIHVHGDLKNPNNVLFGVNDDTQIKDENLAKVSNKSGLFQKPKMAIVCKGRNYEKAQAFLERADIVLLFGLSCGVTDKNWWNLILKRFFNNQLYILFYEHGEDATKTQTANGRLMLKQEIMSKFFSTVGETQEGILKSGLEEKFDIIDYGPHINPDGQEKYCDPLHLGWFGEKLIRKTNRTHEESIKYLKEEF